MATTNRKTQKEAEHLLTAYIARASTSFEAFLGGLVVPSGRGPQILSECMMPHQRECFADLAVSLEALRDGLMPPKRRFWIERTKKASKDTDLAACLLWLLAFPKRPMLIQIGAADRDQAAIIKKRIDDFMYYNAWLQQLIETGVHRLRSKDGIIQLDILAADVSGSHGATPDLLICNELSHVGKWEFIQNLLDNADGVPQGMVVIATNAGFRGTPAEKLRNVVLNSQKWHVYLFQEPAPWLSQEDIEDAKERNSTARYNRLFKGVWSSGKGDAFDDSMIDRCIVKGLAPLTAPEPGWQYIAGLDLGISHDHCGLVVVGVHTNHPKIRLACMRAFAPPQKGAEIWLPDVEEACLRIAQLFRVSWFGYDPYQAKLMAQRLRAKRVPMREVPFTGNRLHVMASTLMEVLREGKLEAFDDDEERLRRDFGKFSIVERKYGYKLESVSDEFGHADVGTALVICLPHAVSLLDGRLLLPTDELACSDYSDLTEEEVEAMPPELREIYSYDYGEEQDDRESWY